MMKSICMLILMIVLNIVSAGCVMPGMLSAKGNLFIWGPTGEEINTIADRTVILTFWRFPSVNNSPPQFEFDNAHLVGKDLRCLRFSTKFYKIVWTPVLGTQHISPEPGVMVLAEGYCPMIGYDVAPINKEPRRCCEAPLDHIREFRLQMVPMSVGCSNLIESHVKNEYVLLIRERKQIERIIKSCRDLTAADRKMVHSILDSFESILND